jgi:Calcium-binding EGF domain.
VFHFLDPCETVFCGPNAQCMLINNEAKCLCSTGYTGTPDGVGGGCMDIDECVANPCTSGAICNNEPGGFSCECPGGTSGDAYREGCTKELPFSCSKEKPCPGSEQCVRDEFVGSSVCICQRGYTRDPETGKCRDINECLELRDKPACGLNAVCRNLPGSYECQCPPGFNGNPFALCEGKSFVFSCSPYHLKLYCVVWLFKLCCFIKVSLLEDFVSRYF